MSRKQLDMFAPERHTVVMMVRLTPSEHRDLVIRARTRQLSIAEYVRVVCRVVASVGGPEVIANVSFRKPKPKGEKKP